MGTPVSKETRKNNGYQSTSHDSDQSSRKDTTLSLQADNSETTPLSRDDNTETTPLSRDDNTETTPLSRDDNTETTPLSRDDNTETTPLSRDDNTKTTPLSRDDNTETTPLSRDDNTKTTPLSRDDNTKTTPLSRDDNTKTTPLSRDDNTKTTPLSRDDNTETTPLSRDDNTETTPLSRDDNTETTPLSRDDNTETTPLSRDDNTETTPLSRDDNTETTPLSRDDNTETTPLSRDDNTETTPLSRDDNTKTTPLSRDDNTKTTPLSRDDNTKTTPLSRDDNTKTTPLSRDDNTETTPLSRDDNTKTTPLSRDGKESIMAESTSHASNQSSIKDTTTTLKADNSETTPLSRDEKDSIIADSTSHASSQSSTQDSTPTSQADNSETTPLSRDEKESISLSSIMTESIPVCGLCIQQTKTTTPTVWCNNCQDLLCQNCETQHNDATATSEHYVITFHDYQKLPSFVKNTKFFCMEHCTTYTHFCHIHDKALCVKCAEMFHKKCKDVSKIVDIIQNVKESVAFERNMTDIEAVCRKLQTLAENREANLVHLKQNFEQMKMEGYNKKTLKERKKIKMESVYKELTNEISGTLEIVQSKEKELCDIINQKHKMITCTNNFQFFIVTKELEHIVYETNKVIENLYKNEQFMEINIEYEMIEKDKVGCGELRVIKQPSSVSIYTSNPTVAQVQTWHLVHLCFQQKIELDDDYEYTVCFILSGGLVAIADDCKMSIHNSDGSLRSTIKFDNDKGVEDVTPVDDHHVAVSHPGSGTISIIDVDSDQVVKKLEVGEEVSGMCCSGRDIVCCVWLKGLVRVNIDSGKVETVVEDWDVDSKSHVEVSNSLICYTCPDTHTVTVLDSQYNVIFTYEDVAVLGYPRGVTIDDHNNIYVTESASHNLVMISSDGKSCHQLLGEDDGLDEPTAVHYDSRTKKLVVVNFHGPAFIYSVK